MGFDIECIIDIHSYPGEYFCPVCRTLVYPNEAFQAQCTHLYCKPCLAHIANGTRACPYDGYLVTESDSKLLMESDKALAEKIGKVKVHCLYFRSGCTWEGNLSDCASHGSGCSFGNSPVICNRCGIQIVHRQVHDHAQICPGVYDGQQAVAGMSGLTRSGTSSTVTAVVNQTVTQSGTPVSQAPNPQNVAPATVPGQNPNLQTNANSHAPAFAPVTVPGPEQWYQQQYHQYYQQYVGYDPYQQSHQQYYQPFQPNQQHLVQVQGQHQSHAYSQAVVQHQTQAQAQPQPQAQTQPHLHLQPQSQQQPNPVPQALQQTHVQPQAQGQGQSQQQPQLQLLPQAQPQVQPPSQGQAQAHAPTQASTPNYLINPQQQPYPAMRPQTQIPPQVLPPPPQGQSTSAPQFPQAMGVRATVQHPQLPQYQQTHVQMHHPQASQAPLQPQMHPQPQVYAQSSNQSNVQIQSQLYQSQSQPPISHPQANQAMVPSTVPQGPHPPVLPVSGHQSYQQQPTQKIQPGTSQQHLVHPQPASGSIHPVQVHGQVVQQPTLMRPPHSHGSFFQQQPSTMLPPQSQVPGTPLAPYQQYLPHGQQPTHPIQHRPAVQPVQLAPPHALQQQFIAPHQGQSYQQGHLPQQQPVKSQMQMRPSGPPQPLQSQNYFGAPVMPKQGISGGFGPLSHTGPAQLHPIQTSINQNYANPNVPEQNGTVQDKGFEGASMKEEVGAVQNETVVKGVDYAVKDGLVKSVIKQEKGDVKSALEQTSEGKSFEAGGAKDEFCKEEVHSLSDSIPLKQMDLEGQMKLSENPVSGHSSANFGNQSLSAVSASSIEGYVLPAHSYGSHQERTQSQVQDQPSSVVGSQAVLPQPGQSVNLPEGKARDNLGGPPKSFGSQSGPQGGPPLSTLADPHGIMGSAPPPLFEGQCAPQHAVRPNEVVMLRDQKSGSGDGGPLSKLHADEPNILRMNGVTASDSAFGSRDPLSREHLNPFPREPTRTLDQANAASRPYDKSLHRPIYDAGSKLDPGNLGPQSRFLPHHPSGGPGHGDAFGSGPGFGQHHIKPFAHRSPGREYLGSPPHGFGGPSSFPRGMLTSDDSREAHKFGEGSRAFNLSSDLVGDSFRDGTFSSLPGQLRRGEVDGPGNPRFGEHRAPGLLHNQMGSNDVFGPDHLMPGKSSGLGYMPSHLAMGETAGPGTFPGHGRVGDGAGNFPHHTFPESVRGDISSFLHFGEPAMRRSYPFHGFSNGGNFASRKRMPMSTGWCRICEVDCETVEGLEMHSQTREHQNMAIDLVKSIKLQNKKKQRASARHVVHEGGSRSRKVGSIGRGSKG